jgi:hypothetical protein
MNYDRDGLMHLYRIEGLRDVLKLLPQQPITGCENLAEFCDLPYNVSVPPFHLRPWEEKTFCFDNHEGCFGRTNDLNALVATDNHRHVSYPIMLAECPLFAPYSELTHNLTSESSIGQVEIAVCRTMGTVLRLDFAEITIQCGLQVLPTLVTIHTIPQELGFLCVANLIRNDSQFLLVIQVET